MSAARKTGFVHLFWLALVLSAASTGAAEPTPGAYRLSDGPYPVKTAASVHLHDAARDKYLMVRVSWPEGEGPFPVIVFSHGMFGSKDGSQPLVRHWVSHGYVCLQPTHADSLSLLSPRQRLKVLRETELRKLESLPHWRERSRDISFLLDSLAEVEKQAPAVRGRIDRDRVGVGGHSFGAHTAQLLWGARMYTGGAEPEVFVDGRVRAVLLISPQGQGPDGLNENSWKRCATPMMTITGSEDGGRNGQPATWRTEPFQNCPPGEKYLVWIQGAHHNFGGISGRALQFLGPENVEHVNLVIMASLAFWDAYLQRNSAAREYLVSRGIEQFRSHAARVTVR